jgi:predicted RNA-binding Zn-ribbon protein involved in translation (DUF1610 family)
MKGKRAVIRGLNQIFEIETHPEGATQWSCPKCRAKGVTSNQYFKFECASCGTSLNVLKIVRKGWIKGDV